MKQYEVKVNNGQVLTMQLSEEDAKRYGTRAKPVATKQASAPENKQRTAANKEAGDKTSDADKGDAGKANGKG